jgi:hypothetical protein
MMSEYANYVEQAAYEDGLERGRQESRQRIKELEKTLIEAERDWEEERRKVRKLEAKLKRVEEVRDDLATQCINDRVYHAVKMLNKALKQKEVHYQRLTAVEDLTLLEKDDAL